jgi:hypothetical protein
MPDKVPIYIFPVLHKVCIIFNGFITFQDEDSRFDLTFKCFLFLQTYANVRFFN